jgi:hypothetical protein
MADPLKTCSHIEVGGVSRISSSASSWRRTQHVRRHANRCRYGATLSKTAQQILMTSNDANAHAHRVQIILRLAQMTLSEVKRWKVKFTLEQTTKDHRRGYIYTFSLTSALNGVIKATPQQFYPRGKRSGTQCAGNWVGPRAGLGACGKSLPQPGFDPRTVQPVASRCTDSATPARLIRQDKLQYRRPTFTHFATYCAQTVLHNQLHEAESLLRSQQLLS